MIDDYRKFSTGIDEFGNLDFVKIAALVEFLNKYPTGLESEVSLAPDERIKCEHERSKYNPSLLRPMLDLTRETVSKKIRRMLAQWKHREDCQVFLPAINDYLTCLRGELHELGIYDLPQDKLSAPTLLEVIEAKDNECFDELWKRYNSILHLALLSLMGTESSLAATKTKQKRNRQRKHVTDRPITPKELEAVKAVGDACGNIALAARRLGKDPKTVREQYNIGMKKSACVMNRRKPKPGLATDRRGQSIHADPNAIDHNHDNDD